MAINGEYYRRIFEEAKKENPISQRKNLSMLEYVASAFNGWHAVKVGGQVGWVSGEYSEITTG